MDSKESRDGKAQFKIGRGHHPPTRKLLHLNKILENKFCHLQLFNNNRSFVKVFICPLGMDDLGLEDEVEVDFDGTPPLFPRENDPQESLAGQTVSHFSR